LLTIARGPIKCNFLGFLSWLQHTYTLMSN
jgi:hypothetical protein